MFMMMITYLWAWLHAAIEDPFAPAVGHSQPATQVGRAVKAIGQAAIDNIGNKPELWVQISPAAPMP